MENWCKSKPKRDYQTMKIRKNFAERDSLASSFEPEISWGCYKFFYLIKTENPFRRGELLNEELRRMKIAEKEKCEGNDNDVEVGEMVRSLDRVAFNIDHIII